MRVQSQILPRNIDIEDILAIVSPAGSVTPFAGSTIPQGYLACDGAEVAITSYKRLYDSIGTTWNTCAKQDGTGGNYSAPSAGNFRIPDLRGVLLRGTGTSSRADGTADVTVTLAAFANDSFASHTHTQDSHNHTQNSHTHTQDSHNHTQNSHLHTINHDHPTASSTAHWTSERTIPGASPGSGIRLWNDAADNTVADFSTTPTRTADSGSTTPTNIATTATNQATTATNQATTATNQSSGSTETAGRYVGITHIIRY